MILAIALVFNVAVMTAQEYAYVSADSGLTLRERPDVNSGKLGKLAYGDAIEITEKTDKALVIIDEGEKVAGKWVKVKTPSKSGYVFNGYLSKEKIAESIEVYHSGLTVELKNLKNNDITKVHSFFTKDTISVGVEVGDTPEGKILVVKNDDYKRVSIFQRYENSVTIMNEGPHCDLTEWEHFYSDWKPIQQINATKFKTLSYSQADLKNFNDVSIEELKAEVIKNCGEDWAKYIDEVKTVNDYPAGVSTSRIFLKIIMTDFDDKVTEKIIEFEIPMGC